MAIVAADIKIYLTIMAGSPGDAQSTPDLSLGGHISSTQISTTVNGLFDGITKIRNTHREADYRCVVIKNTHASITLEETKVWLNGGDPEGGANVAIALDSTGVVTTAFGDQALTAPGGSDTSPGAAITGLTYASPTSYAAGLNIGNIPAGYGQAVWIRRTATNSDPVTSETITLSVQGITVA